MAHVVKYKTPGDRARLIAKYGDRVINEIPEFSVLHVDGCTCEELECEEGVCNVCEDHGMEEAGPDPDFEHPIQNEPVVDITGRHVIAVVDLNTSHGNKVASIASSRGNAVRRYSAGSVFQTLDSTLTAIKDGCKVINLSLIGGTPFWIGVFKYLENLHEAGFDVPLIVTAAGGNVSYNEAYIEPAAYVSPFNLTVGCCNQDGKLVGGTAWGNEVEIFAVETAPSWAAPHASALAAQLMDAGLDALDTRDTILAGARVLDTLVGKCSTGGILDWGATLAELEDLPPTPPVPEYPMFTPEIDTTVFKVAVDGDNASRNEGIKQLVDGKFNTKWLKFSNAATFRITLPGDRLPEALLLVSGNDLPVRDPTSFQIRDGDTGEVLQEGPLRAWTGRRSLQRVVISEKARGAKRWILKIGNTMSGEPGGPNGPIIQLSELDFEWSAATEPAPIPEATWDERLAELEARMVVVEKHLQGITNGS